MTNHWMRTIVRAIALLSVATSAIASTWTVETKTDPMTDKTIVTASARSDNSLSLSFPYAGENHGTLMVRRTSKGLDVIMSIDRGQIPCAVTGCHVVMRFDDGKPMRLSATDSTTHNANLVFVGNESRVFAELKKARRVRVQVDVFHEGRELLDFSFREPLQMK